MSNAVRVNTPVIRNVTDDIVNINIKREKALENVISEIHKVYVDGNSPAIEKLEQIWQNCLEVTKQNTKIIQTQAEDIKRQTYEFDKIHGDF